MFAARSASPEHNPSLAYRTTPPQLASSSRWSAEKAGGEYWISHLPKRIAKVGSRSDGSLMKTWGSLLGLGLARAVKM